MGIQNNYKPDSYNAVSPYFVVEGADKFANMIEEIFGATALRRFDRADGKIMHLELKLDDSVIMLSEASQYMGPNQLMLHIYVPDVQATYEKAIAYGCEEIKKPIREEDDPDVRGMFRDFAGNIWAIGTQINS